MNLIRLAFVFALSLLCVNISFADLSPGPGPNRPFPKIDPPPIPGANDVELLSNAKLSIRQGTGKKTILYIPKKHAKYFQAGNAALPKANSNSRSQVNDQSWGGSQLSTVIAGVAISLALVSAGFLLLRYQKTSQAAAMFLAAIIMSGVSAQIFANGPPIIFDPPAVKQTKFAIPAETDQLEIVISEDYDEVTLLLGTASAWKAPKATDFGARIIPVPVGR
ncbi:MAG: hypothetical protein ACKVH8_03505 [Pirellulales bacterium]